MVYIEKKSKIDRFKQNQSINKKKFSYLMIFYVYKF